MEAGCMPKVFYTASWKQLFQCKNKKKNTILSKNKITQELQLLKKSQKIIKKNQQKKIQKKEKGTKFVPWLETMGWKIYLEKLNQKNLLDSVADLDKEKKLLVTVV